MRQRQHQPEPNSLSAGLNEAGKNKDVGEKVSPALDRAANQTVQRATRGLIRLESRRRMRVLMRRLVFVLTCAAVIGSVYYFFADQLPMDLMNESWEQLKAKLFLSAEPR